MDKALRFARTLERLVSTVGRIFAWLSLPLAAVIVFDVVTRRFFVLGSTKLQELEWHLHAALFLMLLGYAYLRDAHVRIDILRERMSPRTSAWVEVIGCLLFLIPYSMLIIYYSVNFWERSFALDEASAATTGIPHRWIVKTAMPVGFVLLFLAGLSVLLDRVRYLLGDAGLPPEDRR